MALIHGLSNLFPGICQGDIAILIHQNITIFGRLRMATLTHSGLGNQFIGDIDGTDVRLSIAKNQYGFQDSFRMIRSSSMFVYLPAVKVSECVIQIVYHSRGKRSK